MMTMLLGGLWHGAAWTFVLWGALHGAVLCVEHVARRAAHRRGSPRWLRWVVVFHFVVFGWILFRAPTSASSGAFLRARSPARRRRRSSRRWSVSPSSW